MTNAKEFHCTVVTPERVVLERRARFVALPAHDGEIGILRGRAPLLVKLDVGRLRVVSDEGSESLLINGGFAEVIRDRLTVLTQQAQATDELDREGAETLLEEARAMKSVSDSEFEARQRALKKARTQFRLLS
jgi:F-type H+-transporting ATPase subunit epsilon